MSTTAWVSCMPEDDVESFTERSDERSQVFKDAATRLPTGQLFPLVWAFLQVANLEQVKELTKNRFSWMALAGSKFGSGIEYRAKDAVLLWKQRSGDKDMTKQNTTPASSKRSRSVAFSDHPAPSPLGSVNSDLTSPASATKTRSKKPLGGPEYSPRRGRKVAERCKERDNGLCVVSKVSAVDACHIYPWCAFGGKDQGRVESFWDILQMFWPEDKVNAWRAKLFRDDRHNELKGTETVENMLTLTSTLHRFHSGGAFALRPVRISDDKTQLELEFHWLARHEGNSTRKVDLLEEPLSSRDRKDSGSGYQFCRFGNSNPILLVSGTRFMMTTEDAINKPLPDPGLLELQWHLQRILAMSGAAGWKEEDFDHEDPGTSVVAVPSVEQWLDNQPAEYLQSRGSSPSSSAEVVDGVYE